LAPIGSVLVVFVCFGSVLSQASTGTISGTVADQNNAVVAGATVTVKNPATGFTRSAVSNSTGNYRLENLPIGSYQLTVEAPNFSRYVQHGITVAVNQDAVVDAPLKAGTIDAVVTVNGNASLLNTSTAEVSTRFDERRLSELPTAPNRNLYDVLQSVPGVSQLGPGQAAFATGVSISVNGGRLRSNSFLLDGQDMNDPTFTGGEVALNNPDAIQEVRIITNQFRAEYGRNASSIVNFVGKSGTNDYHGSLFWYHNNEYLNACNNLDKLATGAPTGFCNRNAATDARKRAPFRRENQIGFTLGGPLTVPWFGNAGDPLLWRGTDKTFIFGDYQRWSDRELVSGPTLRFAPTTAGRAVLQSVAANRPQVQALLDFVPAGIPNGTSMEFALDMQSPKTVELGDFTGSASSEFDDHQGSVRIDHRFNDKNLVYARYRFDSQDSSGNGQVTPPRLTSLSRVRSGAFVVVLNSSLTSKLFNEIRLAWTRLNSSGEAEYPSAKTIPSIAIPTMGMAGSNAGGARTAIGFPPNQPGFREHDTYQLSDALSYVTGNHSMKFGVEVRRTDARLLGILNQRGTLSYASLSTFVNDRAMLATKSFVLAGGESVGFYRWHEFYVFAQDEWRVRNDLTVTFGLRYEYPGDTFSYLKRLNERNVAANGNDPAFRLDPVPTTDTNNFMPRIGFNWHPHTRRSGIIGFVTGVDKLVIRGGYARTYDPNFTNIHVNMALSFPFVATQSFLPTNAFATVQGATSPNLAQPGRFSKTIVSKDLHAGATDQFSLEMQRELVEDVVIKIGYIRTRGTGLLQTVDGNPCKITANSCLPPNFGNRVNPNLELVTLITNSASSTYDALQLSLTKRLSNNFSGGLHYTWSSFIDDASDVFNPSASENARAQNSFDRRAERARSAYDRPHRLTGNFVYQLPFYEQQRGVEGRVLGGWQINSFFTFQSGAPFTVLLGIDQFGTGNPIRPNLNTTLDLSNMTISEIRSAGWHSFFGNLAPGQRVGNAGRNILRADGVRIVDFGIIKNTRVTQSVHFQLRADIFNSLNHRNFGIPNGNRSSGSSFLDQWATNGGNRRIILGARLVF
ncbi:MAG TPA: TonB-dependent receptor, partial [Pyrinomonadaceae bacterium]|nr:TonB-dependent receptor [Pyrinomonadaceae bacterium]